VAQDDRDLSADVDAGLTASAHTEGVTAADVPGGLTLSPPAVSLPRHRGPRRWNTALLAGLTAAALLGLAAERVTTPTAGLADDRPAPVQLALPDPTGPHRIGTISLHLIDAARDEPWASGRPARELMVQLWYPAQPATGQPRAPWVSPYQARSMRSRSRTAG
jgi:hypothetical protein